MPSCGIIHCAARKDNRHKDLTLHMLPKKAPRRKLWRDAIGVENLKTNTKSIFICSLHFDESSFNRTLNITTLRDDAVPSRIFPPKKSTLAPNLTHIETVINKAVELAQSSQKKSAAAQNPVLKVQPKATSAPKGSICRDCSDTHPITSTPLVIVDIPPAAAIETISPVIIKEIPTIDTKKETRLRNRCEVLDKQLRAWKQKVRRRAAVIDKLEFEKKELTKQHLRALELLKSNDNLDHHFDAILHKAVMKLS